jgi:hypothetical protein
MNSIEWLYKLSKERELDKFDLEQAQAMHKTEIILAYRSVYGKNGKTPNMIALGKIFDKQAEEYYNETYKK